MKRFGTRKWLAAFCRALALFFVLPYCIAQSQTYDQSFVTEEGQAQESIGEANKSSLSEQKDKSDFLSPAACLFLPGWDQWLTGQYPSAASYSLLAGLGWYGVYYQQQAINDHEQKKSFRILSSTEKFNERNHGDIYRKFMVFSQIPLLAGSFSAYQSFRDAVTQRQKLGEYQFLSDYESPKDLALAPFNFTYLKEPTTFIPLILLTALVSLPDLREDEKSDAFTGSDAFFSAAISYNAGTSEEALFRGWLMPFTMQQTNSPFFSNFAQSALFAGAHLNRVSIPYFQFGLGFYLGWLTQKRGWTLSESIFIHAWWDVIAFVSEYQIKAKDPGAKLQPTLRLPPFEISF